MTTEAPAPGRPRTIADLLFAEPYAFDFFQAVRVLEKLLKLERQTQTAAEAGEQAAPTTPEKPELGWQAVGRAGPPDKEVVRFRAHLSLNFPPSEIYSLRSPAAAGLPMPEMTVAFMGLTGPKGVLPLHYTERLLNLDRDVRGPERYALRYWFDLFNHRLISLFYRAWEKYRFYVPYERGEYRLAEPSQDPFTRCLFSLVGLGTPSLRNRLTVSTWDEEEEQRLERPLVRIDDLVLLHYSGLLAHRPRCVVSLEALLLDYFRLPVRIQQFQGQWLCLEPASQSRMGDNGRNNELGLNLVAGDRVWDVQGKFRVRLGPLRYAQFVEFLPDPAPVPQRKTFFLLSHLVRLYVGPEFDFDVQLVLKAEDVPECQLAESETGLPRLGWNTWIRSLPFPRDAEEAVFEGEERRWVKNSA